MARGIGSGNERVRQVVSLDEDWTIREARPARRTVRGAITAAGDRDMLAFLASREALEPVHEVVAETSARRRAGVAPRPLQLSITSPKPGEPYVAAARHESGALTFHLPESGVGVRDVAPRRRRRARGGEAVVFSIPLLPSDELVRDAGGGLARRGIISNVVKVVVFKAAGAVAQVALRHLARRLEERLWRHRAQGWVRVTADALARGGPLRPEVPRFRDGERGLLLIHGTFSNAASAFHHLANADFFDAVARRYGDRVYAFEHFTISKSPEDNVRELLEALPRRRRMTFDVITHSRGGLVLRTLARDGNAKVNLGRVVLVASPNQGTPLATPDRWENTVGWFANLLEVFPDNPFTTAAEWVAGSLSWLAQSIAGAGGLPGLSSMDGDGDVVRTLRSVAMAADSTYALAANFEPPEDLLLRMADIGVDAFFAGANDLVVPTAGGWDLGAPGAAGDLGPAQIGCFGPGGNLAPGQPSSIHHLNFFANPDGRRFIRQALAGEPLQLSPITMPSNLPRRRAIDRLTAAVAERETVALPAPDVSRVVADAVAREIGALRTSDDWNREEVLQLIVLPASTKPDRTMRAGATDATTTRKKKTAKELRPDAQLLAIYGSARVLSDFHLSGDHDFDAGQRWRDIFRFQRTINQYVEGAVDAPTAEKLQDFGACLFDTLLCGDVRRLYDQARGRHAARRIEIVFTSMIPWVADLPWEFAFDRNCKTFLATSDVRFVRNVLTAVPPDDIEPREGPLRILVVSAQPSGTAELSVDEERQVIQRSFQPLIDAGAVQVDVLPRATPGDMHGWVQSERYDALHFIGHGQFDNETQCGYLIFEDAQRRPVPVDTSCVRDILRGRGIKLVFLNACETGRGGRADYNQGVAPGLVADGVPAVVANQYSVLDRSATTFAQHFYWCLAQGLSLGEAARESLIALNYSVGEAIDWAVPVLFARNPDAVLCRDVIRRDVPKALPCTSDVDRRSTAKHNRCVSVWDVADAFPELRRTLDLMNQAHPEFGFRLVNLTAPYGTWQVKKEAGESIAYLKAERVAKRMRATIRSLKSDVLFCVTDMPLRDESTKNIYMWWGDMETDPIIIFSTWGFEPPLRGPRLSKAVANMSVAGLAALLTDSESFRAPRGSVFYYNKERDVGHLVGDLTIDPKGRRALKDKKVGQAVLDAFEALLRAFPAVVDAERSAQRKTRKRARGSRKR